MNVTEKILVGYELHPSGIIFVITTRQLFDESGAVVATPHPHRAPYESARRRQANDKAPVTIEENDLSTHPDETLKQLAAIWWTPEVKSACRATHQAALDAAAIAAAKGPARAKSR